MFLETAPSKSICEKKGGRIAKQARPALRHGSTLVRNLKGVTVRNLKGVHSLSLCMHD